MRKLLSYDKKNNENRVLQKIKIAYLMIIITIVIVAISGVLYIESYFTENKNNIIFLEDFVVNGEISEQIVDTPGEFKTVMYIDEKEFDKVDGDGLLIIPRIYGAWHKIYFNNSFIGSIGEINNTQINLWNDVYKIIVPERLIDQEENILEIKTFSEHKIGQGRYKMFIVEVDSEHDIYYAFKLIYQKIYRFLTTILFHISILGIFVLIITPYGDKSSLFILFSVLFGAISLLDYGVLNHFFISSLVFKKMLVFAFHCSIVMMAFYIEKKYKNNLVKRMSQIILVLSLIAVILSPNIIVFSYYYEKIFILIFLLVLMLAINMIKAYKKFKKKEDIYILFSVIMVMITGTYDVVSSIFFGGRLLNLTMYGSFIAFIGLLLVGFNAYFSEQSQLNLDKNRLKLEKERLQKTLDVDELTGLYNHNYFYKVIKEKTHDVNKKISILIIDIDKFRPINELVGHDCGNEIIKIIGQKILDVVGVKERVFRYSGKTFAVISTDETSDTIKTLGETIKYSVLKDAKLQKKSLYLPLTLSIGIAKFPTDSIDIQTAALKAFVAVTYAKLNGRNQVCVYSVDIDSKVLEFNKDKDKKQMLIDFVYSLAKIIDLKDSYTGFHSQEVSRYAQLIAEKMSLGNKMDYSLRLGGLLHDVGKLSISDSIINKTGKLTDDEYEQIKDHPKVGFEIVKQLIGDNDALACVKSHHERYDGKGYPDGLKGDEIPLSARITCVADSYHAMISSRSYRAPLTKRAAMLELSNNKTSQFDPEVVDAFIEILSNEKLD